MNTFQSAVLQYRKLEFVKRKCILTYLVALSRWIVASSREAVSLHLEGGEMVRRGCMGKKKVGKNLRKRDQLVEVGPTTVLTYPHPTQSTSPPLKTLRYPLSGSPHIL